MIELEKKTDSNNRGQFWRMTQHMIHQMKGNIFLYLVSDVILRIDIKVKNNMIKTDISVNN